MIYKTIKLLFGLAVRLFFKSIEIEGQENIPKKGPLILVANHPNTLLDPVLVGVITKQQVGYVAMASLFNNPILARILTFLHVLPVVRKQDLKPGEKADNLTTFRKAHDYLRKGSTLAIFPEGASFYEMKLQELKTGTARIALSFEKSENYKGNLRIVPIAMDYSDSIQFRSSIKISVNPPILVSKYAEKFDQNESAAVHELTDEIRENLAQYIPQTAGKEQEELLIKLHTFYTTYIESEAKLKADAKRSLGLRYKLAEKINDLLLTNRSKCNDLKDGLECYFDLIATNRLSPGFFTEDFFKKNQAYIIIGYIVKLMLLLPFYLYGLLINYIPYSLPLKVYKALKLKIEYKTSVELVVGLLVFPSFFAILTWIFSTYISSEIGFVALFILSLLLSGYLTIYYWSELKRFLRLCRFMQLSTSRKEEILKHKNLLINEIINI